MSNSDIGRTKINCGMLCTKRKTDSETLPLELMAKQHLTLDLIKKTTLDTKNLGQNSALDTRPPLSIPNTVPVACTDGKSKTMKFANNM